MPANDLYAQALLGQVGQAGQRQDPRRAMAARLLAGSQPAAPLTSPTSTLAYALSQGLDAFSGQRMQEQAENQDEKRRLRTMGELRGYQDEQQQRRDAISAGLWGGGAPAPSAPAQEAPAMPSAPPAGPVTREPLPAPQGASGNDPRALNEEAARRRDAVLSNASLSPEQQAAALAEVSAWRASAGGTPPIPGGYRANPGVDGAFAGVAPPSGVVPPVMPAGGQQPSPVAVPQQPPQQPAGQPNMAVLQRMMASGDPQLMQQAQGVIAMMRAQQQMDQPRLRSVAPGDTVFDDRTGRPVYTAPRPDEGGTFRGTGMDAQALNLLLAPNADPASPAYAAAYQQVYGPRLQTQPDGSTITVQPMPPAGIRPPTGQAAPATDGRPSASVQTPAGTVTRTQGRGTPLSDSASRQFGDLARTAGEWRGLLDTFRPDYAGYGSDVVGNAAQTIARNTPGASPRADWWQRYNMLANIERNELFGSALTASEQAAWRSAMIGPGMNPDQVRMNMARQAEIAQAALLRRVRAAVANGTNIEALSGATGIPVDAIMGNPMAASPDAPNQGAEPRRVTTREEAEALPPGTLYVTPDGRRFTR